MLELPRAYSAFVLKQDATFAQIARFMRALDEMRAVDKIKHEPILGHVMRDTGYGMIVHHVIFIDSKDENYLMSTGRLTSYLPLVMRYFAISADGRLQAWAIPDRVMYSGNLEIAMRAPSTHLRLLGLPGGALMLEMDDPKAFEEVAL